MISLRDICLNIRGEYLFSIKAYDFIDGKKYLLLGDNGTGKSSLMKSLIKSFDFVTGEIIAEGSIVYQPQEPYLFQKTVKDNFKISGMSKKQMEEGLSELYAEDIIDKKVRVLSGGQRQKTALLRSLFKATKVLLLDEPFSQMDEKSTLAAQLMVERWHGLEKDRILVMISHDVELSAMSFDEKLILRNQGFFVEEIR